MNMLTHIVLFKFKAETDEHEIETVVNNFKQLAVKCKNQSGEVYIKSLHSGINISIENLSKGFTHAFVVTFTSRADRDYYISEDPVHIAFTKTLSSIDDVLVVDFED